MGLWPAVSVFVSCAVKGFLDDIYATLVVKLADSESFQLKELWRDAADFVTLAGDHHMGLTLTRASGSAAHSQRLSHAPASAWPGPLATRASCAVDRRDFTATA